eukprot:7025786-Alexandrium_andersonii.AAC.1
MGVGAVEGGKSKGKGKKCDVCGKSGHVKKDCWYAKGQKGKGDKGGGKKGAQKFQGKCNWCKKVGHKEAECRQKAAGKPK